MLARRLLGNFLPYAQFTSQESRESILLPRQGIPLLLVPALYSVVASIPTNREIEIKLPVADLPLVIARLQHLRPLTLGRVFERNTLYDTPESDLWRAGCLLRLRIERPAASALVAPGPPRAVLTSKAPPASRLLERGYAVPKPRFNERLERELAVHHPDRWSHTLKKLGFRTGFRYEKYRTSLRRPGLHMDLDETPVGNFLELEGVPKAIEAVARALGYAHRDYLRVTYWDLYVADCKRKGRAAENMVFDT
jgi:adenylate cyclase class 2